MDTEGVRLFVLAAEKLNISAAGRALGMGPAVASSRLAKLENELGAELLHRTTRRVALSLEGAEFLPYAKEMLAQENAALAALGHGTDKVTGTLRFTAPSTFAQLYIAPILSEFLSRHVEVSLDLRFSDALFNLIEGSFDLALRNAPLAGNSFKGRKLADDKRVLCASPAYLRQRGIPSAPEDLSAHELIAFKDRAPRELIDADGAKSAFEPSSARSRLVVDDGLSQKVATLASAGISINSLWSVHQELAQGTLVRVLPRWEVNDGSVLWLVYPKSNVLTSKVRVFIDFLVEKIGQSPPWLAGMKKDI